MPISDISASTTSKLYDKEGRDAAAAELFSFPSGRWVLFFAIISAIYTANVVQWSLRFGRLAMDPVFDDVGYLTDGLQRLNVLDSAGFRAFCETFIQVPPHSPWSTLLAAFGFAIFGVHDWAPYLLNGLLVFLLLCLAWSLVGHKSAVTRFALISVILFLQLPFQAVLEFRPDFAAALFTAGFSILFLKMGFYETEPKFEVRNYFCVGLLSGLALSAKPSFFPLTGAMLIAAIFLSEINRCLFLKRRFEIGGIARRTLSALAGAALLAGPYFVANWRALLDYLTSNIGSGKDADIWRVRGGFWASLDDRLHGYSVNITLGRFFGLLAMWLIVGVALAVWRRNYRALLFSCSGVLLTAMSLLIIAAGQMIDPHFSYLWTILFVLTALYAVAECTKSSRLLVVLFCATVVFTFIRSSSTKYIWLVIKDTARNGSLNEEIVRRIAARATADGSGRTPSVYATFMGKVNSASQNWLAVRDKIALTFRDLHRSGDIAEHLAAIQSADFVEVADEKSQWLDRWLPSAQLQGALLEDLRKEPLFRELPPVIGKEGTVFLFEKTGDK